AIKETIVGAAAGTAALSVAAGGPLASTVAGLTYGVLANILVDFDIILPDNDRLHRSRKVATHEYGHYLFASLLYERNSGSIDYVLWQTFLHTDISDPVRAINEGFADF